MRKVWEVARDAYVKQNDSPVDVERDPSCVDCGDTLLAFVISEVADVTTGHQTLRAQDLWSGAQAMRTAAQQLEAVADALLAERDAMVSVATR